MADELKEAVAKLTGFVCNAHPDHGDVSAFLLKPHIERVLSTLKAVERPQPLPGDGEGVKAELAREEAAHLNTIDQRDAAEEALSRAYFLVAGRHPPWSNVFQYSDALAEIEETVAAISHTPGREEIASSVGSPPEGGTPSPSDGQVLRHVAGDGCAWPSLGALYPPFAKNGVGSKLLAAAEAYLDDYVLSQDEGWDYEPSEKERELMRDMINGLFSDHTFWGLLQHLIYRALAAPVRCDQPLPPELAARILDVNLSGEPSVWDELGAAAIRHAWASVRPMLAALIALGTAGEDVDAAKVPRDEEAQRPHSDLEDAIRDRDALKAERDALRQWCEARAVGCGDKAHDPTLAESLKLGWAMSADTFACVIEKIDALGGEKP